MSKKPVNYDKPPRKLSHASLTRVGDESPFRSKCPVCPNGVLLVQRDQKSFALQNLDSCVVCGQRVIYTDKFINGEPVTDVTTKKHN